jgi:hypothetical protein
LVDDNPNIISGASKNLTVDKIYILPDYAYNKHVKLANVYHLKASLSNLRETGF